MSFELPEQYIIEQFLTYSGYPKVHQNPRFYSGGCPICREGNSWEKKRRLFYIPKYNNLHCKNCNGSWSPLQWIMEVSGKSFSEIVKESKDYEFVSADFIYDKIKDSKPKLTYPLPQDSINLFDPIQLEYYKNNEIIEKSLKFILKRRINTAINKPKDIYISLNDEIHKNRLCIPFINLKNEVSFYQSRTILESDDDKYPKYLGKSGGEKTVFGINSINEDIDYIFLFEGPIDAMFVRNGVALAGVEMSKCQKAELDYFPFHKKIWVLDNQKIDQTSREKTEELINENETVFIWPDVKACKDFNDLAIRTRKNEIPFNFIIKNSYSGMKALLNLKKIRN